MSVSRTRVGGVVRIDTNAASPAATAYAESSRACQVGSVWSVCYVVLSKWGGGKMLCFSALRMGMRVLSHSDGL